MLVCNDDDRSEDKVGEMGAREQTTRVADGWHSFVGTNRTASCEQTCMHTAALFTGKYRSNGIRLQYRQRWEGPRQGRKDRRYLAWPTVIVRTGQGR